MSYLTEACIDLRDLLREAPQLLNRHSQKGYLVLYHAPQTLFMCAAKACPIRHHRLPFPLFYHSSRRLSRNRFLCTGCFRARNRSGGNQLRTGPFGRGREMLPGVAGTCRGTRWIQGFSNSLPMPRRRGRPVTATRQRGFGPWRRRSRSGNSERDCWTCRGNSRRWPILSRPNGDAFRCAGGWPPGQNRRCGGAIKPR